MCDELSSHAAEGAKLLAMLTQQIDRLAPEVMVIDTGLVKFNPICKTLPESSSQVNLR